MALRPVGTLGLGLAARAQSCRLPPMALARPPLNHFVASQQLGTSTRPASFKVTPSSSSHRQSTLRPPSILSLALSIRSFTTGTSIRSTAPADPATTTPPSPSASPQPDTSAKPTSKWVGYHSLFLAFLVYAIVVVGGLTRLTESGLSITEWNPGFKGMWLPTTTDEWEGEWAKYRQTPEFVLLNSKMSLEDFKTIYMWEWSHRILGRVIGLAYVLPAAFFVARGMVKSPFRSKLLLIGLGIGAQGAMGWYMVKSGLAAPQGTLHVSEQAATEGTAAPQQPHSDALAPPKTSSTPAAWTPRVSHFRLAAHLGLAFLVYAGMLRTGLSVLRQYNLAMNVGKASGLKAAPGVRDKLVAVLSKPQVLRYRRFVGAVTGLVFATAMSGALVAGLDAGLVYNEFPTMGDGRIAPPLDEMFDERYTRSSGASSRDDEASSSSLVLHNLTQNPVTVQFVHRCLAITTFAHVAALAWKTRNLSATMRLAGTALPPAVPRLAYLALGAATAQATLGITTLIYMVPIELASAHQAGSVALLSVMLALWGTLRVPGALPVGRMVDGAKRAASVTAAASSGSATAASAAAGAPRLARAIHSRPVAATSPSVKGSRGFSTTSAPCRSAPRTLADLPDKVKLKTGPAGRLSKILPARESHDITTRVGSSYGGNHSLQWIEEPRNLLVVTKRCDEEVNEKLRGLVSHVNQAYPSMNIVIEAHNASALQDQEYKNLVILPSTSTSSPTSASPLSSKIDLILTLGGDGTILHASSLFSHSPVPPVLSFSMGTLGFLLPWHIDSMKEALRDVLGGKVTLLLRMRLSLSTHEGDGSLVAAEGGKGGRPSCEVHLMNEVTLHRGSQPHMTTIDAYVDGEHLTRAISDGLIIASPTGSTAYSLSAGGSIVHPSVQSLLLTPICPRSLSFRPLVLPSDTTVQLRVSPQSRSPAEITVDGRTGWEDGERELDDEEGGVGQGVPRMLKPGQYLQVSMSPYPIPCVNRSLPKERWENEGKGKKTAIPDIPTGSGGSGTTDRGEDDWVRDINRLLRFNASFTKRPSDD